ncbi:MAG: phage minor head protein [Rhodoferax sp.]|nr:phage minor head protein [Rhodoferax sp.]
MGCAHPRKEHLAWHGLTLPHDHPFWQTHFPPNGWLCHCRVTGVTQAEGQRSAKAGLGTPPSDWDKRHPTTGDPIGIDKVQSEEVGVRL